MLPDAEVTSKQAVGKRTIAASFALLGVALLYAQVASSHRQGLDAANLAFIGAIAVAAVGITRRSLAAQVLARAMGWLAFIPGAVVFAHHLGQGRFAAGMAAIATASGAALWLARPMLQTREARAAFAPARFRGLFLAGATSAAATGLALGAIGIGMLGWGVVAGAGVALLGGALVASGLAVVRMRSWGALLPALLSAVALTTGAFAPHAIAFVLAATTLPATLLLLPVLLARLGFGSTPRASENERVRIAAFEQPVSRTIDDAAALETISSEDAEGTSETRVRHQGRFVNS